MRLAKLITKRLTTMVVGHDRFPAICVPGDPAAEDAAREVARGSKLRTAMHEARDIGGACGTVVLSWGYVADRPVIGVHSPALIEVLEWADWEQRLPARVLRVAEFRDRVWRDGTIREEKFWRVRYWDAEREIVWEPIPDRAAQTAWWQNQPVVSNLEHGCGRCPVLWVQNIRDSGASDGRPDADGQHGDFDRLDVLNSQLVEGTGANLDPTLVINAAKGKDDGVVYKGTGRVIFSQGGASYLELQGKAAAAGKDVLMMERQAQLDEAEVVLLDPDKLSGAGVSAASLRVRFEPMLAKCDLLRDQYGDAIVTLVTELLRSGRRLGVPLAPKFEKGAEVPRTWGQSEAVELTWPAYFVAGPDDKKTATDTAVAATGGKPVLSQRTAIERLLASPLDIQDVDAEVEALHEESEEMTERAAKLMPAGPEDVYHGPEEIPALDPEEAEED
jgi:hypothetical protein